MLTWSEERNWEQMADLPTPWAPSITTLYTGHVRLVTEPVSRLADLCTVYTCTGLNGKPVIVH